MFKKTFKNTNLTCMLQQDTEFEQDNCLNGVISKTRNGFLFEEAVRRGYRKRNPKLFEGKYCSLVHMRNGMYKIHMKSINASKIKDRGTVAFSVYSEILSAFDIINS